MNFVEEYNKGKEGRNKGLPTGIPILDRTTDGIQRKAIYGIGAQPKVGKTTFVDYVFILAPSLLAPDEDVDYIYFSFEIDRVKKEFKFASFFFAYDYGITKFTHNGIEYPISPRYLLGRLVDPEGKTIRVTEEHEGMLRKIYRNRIVPLFGEYDEQGQKICPGKIDFVEERENPTGLRNYLMAYARRNGKFTEEEYTTLDESTKKPVKKKRINGYIPNDPNKRLIIITDHLRKLKKERGYSTKENIDKFIEYQVELRNWCGFTFVDIIHLNRSLSSTDRIQFNGEFLYPTGDDVKDTGNLSEEADYMFTLMNPNDEKYRITKHFGLELQDLRGRLTHPDYRSLHLVESRDTECPMHYQLDMLGNVNMFQEIKVGDS